MTDIKPIQNDYVKVKGPFGVLNEGTGYAIVNIANGERVAHNISSFLDCVKTIDYLLGNLSPSSSTPSPKPAPPPQEPVLTHNRLNEAIRHLKPDVQRLIEKYAHETVRVSKSTNFLGQSRYKCYDLNGNVLGRVRGDSSNRYWQYGGLDDQKYY